MKNLTLMICLIISITSSFAKETIFINEGTTAPFSGILMTEERAAKAMKAEKKVLTLQDLRITDNKIIEYYKDEAKQTKRLLDQERTTSTFKAIGYFVLGSLLTGLAAKVAIESTR